MTRRIALIFPGQGSQLVGMAAGLAEQYPEVRDLFERAVPIVGRRLFTVMAEGPEGELQETRVSQPAIFLANVALAVALGPGLVPIVAAGHSFGEYCALTLAGSLSFEDALHLVYQRGLAMGRAADAMPGTMAAVLGLDAERLAALVEQVRQSAGVRVRLANFNAPSQIVISGDWRGVELLGAAALEAGAKRVVPLNVSGAWHSELMESAQREFAPIVAAAAIALPRFSVISNVDALPYQDVEVIRHHLVRSVTDEVRWHETALAVLAQEPDLVIECGASRVLSPLVKRLLGAPEVLHVGDVERVGEVRRLLEDR